MGECVSSFVQWTSTGGFWLRLVDQWISYKEIGEWVRCNSKANRIIYEPKRAGASIGHVTCTVHCKNTPSGSRLVDCMEDSGLLNAIWSVWTFFGVGWMLNWMNLVVPQQSWGGSTLGEPAPSWRLPLKTRSGILHPQSWAAVSDSKWHTKGRKRRRWYCLKWCPASSSDKPNIGSRRRRVWGSSLSNHF